MLTLPWKSMRDALPPSRNSQKHFSLTSFSSTLSISRRTGVLAGSLSQSSSFSMRSSSSGESPSLLSS